MCGLAQWEASRLHGDNGPGQVYARGSEQGTLAFQAAVCVWSMGNLLLVGMKRQCILSFVYVCKQGGLHTHGTLKFELIEVTNDRFITF